LLKFCEELLSFIDFNLAIYLFAFFIFLFFFFLHCFVYFSLQRVVVFYFCFIFCFCIALFVLLWVRACGAYQDFLDRGLLLTRMLLNQGFLLVTSSLRKFTIDAMLWLTAMEYLCHKWPRICSNCRNHLLVLSSFKTYHRVCN
jgi:hypothetical protein